MKHTYRLGSHMLISDIEIPELMPWTEECEPREVLRFKLGHAKGDSGRKTYVVHSPCRIVIEDGIQVTVEITQDVDVADTRALLMGPVQAILWHQRGLLPLHASAIAVNGSALAIAGESGVGKSTVAAILAMRGHPVLADDISIVDPKTASILTGQSRLRLWRNTLERLGVDINGLPRAMSRSEKYLLMSEGSPVAQSHKLAHIVLLKRDGLGPLQMRELKGSDAVFALLEVVHLLPSAHELGLGNAVFSALTNLRASGVRVWRCFLPDELDRIESAAQALLECLDR